MAKIVINEVSQNYTYNIGNNSFATVALPITSSWGPGFFDYQEAGMENIEEMLEYTAWEKFPATQSGLESFVSTYRGPASNYRLAQDYSYQMAMTLLTAGYDVLICRMSPGMKAEGQIKSGSNMLHVKAKYPGTFGNSLRVELKKYMYRRRVEGKYESAYYWNIITSIIDDSGIKTSVENKAFVFDINNATDSIPHWTELNSDFIDIVVDGNILDEKDTEFVPVDMSGKEIPSDERLSALPYTDLSGGTDRAQNPIDANLQEILIQKRNAANHAEDRLKELMKVRTAEERDLQAKYRDLAQRVIDLQSVLTDLENQKTSLERQLSSAETDYASAKDQLKIDFDALEAARKAWEAVEDPAYGEDEHQAYIEAQEKYEAQSSIVETIEANIKALNNSLRVLNGDGVDNPGKIKVASDAVTAAENARVEQKNKIPTQNIVKYTDAVLEAQKAVKDAESASEDGTYRALIDDAITLANMRFDYHPNSESEDDVPPEYIQALIALRAEDEETHEPLYEVDVVKASNIRYREWLYTFARGVPVPDAAHYGVYDLLKDKLTYNPNRILTPGWDDQDILYLSEDDRPVEIRTISPLSLKIMDVAYYSRCATGMIDIPKSLARAYVFDEDLDPNKEGYAQKLARYIPDDTAGDVNGSLYQSHSALFAPWGRYTYVGTSKQAAASPSFLALMIQRAQILNQAAQYEWILPTNRKHNLRIGKMDYNVPKKYLDKWQTLEGVGVNVITKIPDLGTNIWGNSTLFEVPPATYQALANLSTRYLVNAVEDVIYRVGIGITFSYNNEQAYNKFYAGCTPILDTMKNVGAIEDYYVKMSADINGLDHVNANSVIGKVYLVVNGVINDITCDLVALPPGVDLSQFRG